MNNIKEKLNNNVKILVEGINVNNYIKRLIKNGIEIINLNYISYNKVEIIIKYSDYKKISSIRTIYKLKVIDIYGKQKIKNKIKKGYILFISLIFALSLVILFSNIILSVDIIHTDSKLVNKINNILINYGIEKYKFRKSYDKLEEIEKEILGNNKEILEWIEIERVGTKYIVRLEERKIKEENNSNEFQNIVMSKNGVIKKIVALSGEKVKEINTYAKRGEVVISGNITKPNGEIVNTMASGNVYASIWYNISIEYPYHYKEEVLTGNKKQVYYISFINKRISLFDYNKFNSFKSDKKIIITNPLIPFSFIKEKQYEVNIIDEIYTYEQVIDKAIKLSEERLLSSNDKIDSIEQVSVISKEDKGSKIKLNLFISVIEEVGQIQIIENIPNEEVIEE